MVVRRKGAGERSPLYATFSIARYHRSPVQMDFDGTVRRLDIGLAWIDRSVKSALLPSELAILMVGVASRQAACPTARLQAQLGTPRRGESLMNPMNGAFNAATAALITKLQQE